MNKIGLCWFIITACFLSPALNAFPQEFRIINSKGAEVFFQPPTLNGIKMRPLKKVIKRLNDANHPNFFSIFEVSHPNTDTLTVQFKNIQTNQRLSVYRICHNQDNENILTLHSTRFITDQKKISFNNLTGASAPYLLLFTLEKTNNLNQLNSHIQYLRQQNNQIELNGYGTNWSMSELKLKMTGKNEDQSNDKFVKDSEWLVEQLIAPEWIIAIMVKESS